MAVSLSNRINLFRDVYTKRTEKLYLKHITKDFFNAKFKTC